MKMTKTLLEAQKKAMELDKITPNMKTEIIEHKEVSKNSPFRFNFRFKERKD